MFSKNAEMAIGTMILFIAVILSVTIAAGIFIQTSNSLQSKALTTGMQTKDKISSQVSPVEITISKNSDDEYRNIEMIAKLSPGSSPINLKDFTILQSLSDTSSTSKYRENGEISRSTNGFISIVTQEIGILGVNYEEESDNIQSAILHDLSIVDFDLDGVADSIKLCPPSGATCPDGTKNTGNYLGINLSSSGSFVYVQITNSSGGAVNDLCQLNDGNTQAAMTKAPVGNYGYLSLSGDLCDLCCFIEASNAAITLEYHQKETQLTEDLDMDNNNSDTLEINQTHAIFYFTNGDTIPIEFNNPISAPTTLDVYQNISNGSTTYGTLTISGTTTNSNIIDESITFQIIPQEEVGYFVSEFLQTGQNFKNGTIHNGDLVKFYMESPRALVENEPITIVMLPENAMQTKIEMYSRPVMAKIKEPLYP